MAPIDRKVPANADDLRANTLNKRHNTNPLPYHCSSVTYTQEKEKSFFPPQGDSPLKVYLLLPWVLLRFLSILLTPLIPRIDLLPLLFPPRCLPPRLKHVLRICLLTLPPVLRLMSFRQVYGINIVTVILGPLDGVQSIRSRPTILGGLPLNPSCLGLLQNVLVALAPLVGPQLPSLNNLQVALFPLRTIPWKFLRIWLT